MKNPGQPLFKHPLLSIFLAGTWLVCMEPGSLLGHEFEAAASGFQTGPESDVEISDLKCEYKVDPIGIDIRKPRLSWKIRPTGRRGIRQTGYQVRVAGSLEDLESGSAATWDSARTDSAESIHRPYAGPALESCKRYYWKIRIWDEAGRVSRWSAPALWEMGLLELSDWKADWITPASRDASRSGPAPMFRHDFEIDGGIQSARAYATSLGLYEMEINGHRVGDQLFTPGWTSYKNRLQYQTYDITDLVRTGKNAVGVTVGDGWYRGNIGFRGERNFYGSTPALLVLLRIEKPGGRIDWIGTGPEWTASTGPILMSDIYMGERYDARLERKGWSSPGFDSRSWRPVQVLQHPKDILVAPEGPPVRAIEEIRPVKIFSTPSGRTVFDMGQNMVGWIRLQVRGKKGRTVTLRHAEVLDPAGNLYTENLRKAAQTVEYTMRGGDPETYQPHFTFQGFRYVAVEGFPGKPTLDSLTGIVIHSDMAVTGSFESSNPAINQLQHNILWGQKGNFLDVPTDCPQRDERLGWTGDAQVFAETASFNMDVAAFLTKWLKDLAADQSRDGRIPHVIPDVLGAGGSAAWADAGVIIPWTLYRRYGDQQILGQQYDSMKRWVEYVRQRAGDDLIWDGDFHFGDWLAFATTRSDYPGATTDKDLIATAFFAYSTALLQKTAQILGNHEDSRNYGQLLGRIQSAFLAEFVTNRGRVTSNTQTALTLALMFDLLPQELRPEAARRLARDVRSFGNHITTGFVGTPYLCHVLSRFGYLDVAYDLLNQDTYPSWLYPVKMGATTIWERWDGIRPDGSFQNAGMNSFNHYAYGAIGSWLYGVVAGIRPDAVEPGFKRIVFEPEPGGGLTRVEASLESMYGTIRSAWKVEDGQILLTMTVPPNTRASIKLPGAQLPEVLESGKPISEVVGLLALRQEGDSVRVESESGEYHFSYAWKKSPPQAGS